MIDCMKEVARKNAEQRKQYFLDKCRSFECRVTVCGKYKLNFIAGTGTLATRVCRQGFLSAYCISKWYLDNIVSMMKAGYTCVTASFNDRSAIPAEFRSSKDLLKFADSYDIKLSMEMLGNVNMPNSVSSLIAVAWMQYFFSLVGDCPPCGTEEVHLDQSTKHSIYDEYVNDMSAFDNSRDPLSERSFLELWRNVYKHVKRRKFKHCCGKCNVGSALSELRRKYQDSRGRREVTMLFNMHRITFMGERRMYYTRRGLGLMESWAYISGITDGMQQNRCLLPWFGHKKAPPKHLKQHLQGLLLHGRSLDIYRSFSNVRVTASFCIYTWLLSLEKLFVANGRKSVGTIFHQIDGGSENANVLYLVVCFMLVLYGICEKVVLTRLLPGHTHEDIDGLFALIWNYLKDRHCLSPDEFEDVIKSALQKYEDKLEVKNILVVPDFSDWFDGLVDPKVERFAKEEWTQLQFIFERVEPSERYEHGVKATCRPYAKDEVVEIVDDPDQDSITGLIPQLTKVNIQPADEDPPFNFLLRLPREAKVFKPEPFVAMSRQHALACSYKMIQSYTGKNPAVVESWTRWRDSVLPQSDDADEYVAEHPMYIPFKDQLFSGNPAPERSSLERADHATTLDGVTLPPMRVVESTTSSLCHSGKPKPSSKKHETPARLVVRERDGSVPSQPKEARAGIIVTQKTPRKTQTKKGYSSGKKKESATKKKGSSFNSDIITSDDIDGFVAEVEDEEEESEYEEEEEEGVRNFELGAVIQNMHRLRGTITACHDDGSYDVKYKDGRTDENVSWKLLFPPPAPRKSTSSKKGSYEMMVVPDDYKWVDTGAVSSAIHSVSGKRKRSNVNYKM